MPAYRDVSEALDVISDIVDEILIRKENGWVGVPADTLSGGGTWKLVDEYDFSTPMNEVITDKIAGYSNFRVIINNIQGAVNSRVIIRVSTDGGSTFYAASGDYSDIRNNGNADSYSQMYLTESNTTAPKTALLTVENNGSGAKPIMFCHNYGPYEYLFNHTHLPINAVQIYNNANTNWVAGTMKFLVR